MGVGAGLYMCDVVKKSSRSLSHLLMSSCWQYFSIGLRYAFTGVQGTTYGFFQKLKGIMGTNYLESNFALFPAWISMIRLTHVPNFMLLPPIYTKLE